MIYDIGIIGGGTAGLTAAVYGQRAGKSTLVLEGTTYGGQIVTSPKVENYPGIVSISGAEFSRNLLGQASALGAQTKNEQAKRIYFRNGRHVIETAASRYECRTVILAAGMVHRHLGLPQETKLAGAGVSYCATCDGMFFRGRDVAVVGGGNTALQDAEFLANYCSKVYLIHRRAEFRGEENQVENLRKKENVEFVLDSVVKDIPGEQMVEGLAVTNKITGEDRLIPVSGVFIAVGQIPQNDVFAEYVKLDGAGFVLASEDCVTSRAGVFAAGDCRTKEVRQLTTAAADGAVAALAAVKYINAMERA